MIYILMDEGELVGAVANIEDAALRIAIIEVDRAFRSTIDTVPHEELEYHLCQKLGIQHKLGMACWHDVLLAYLTRCGATLVEYREIEAVPAEAPRAFARETKEYPPIKGDDGRRQYCPSCEKEVRTVPGEGVPNQTLRCCAECGSYTKEENE